MHKNTLNIYSFNEWKFPCYPSYTKSLLKKLQNKSLLKYPQPYYITYV